MKFSICQMDIVPGDPEANRKRVQSWVESIMKGENPDTIVLPEMWTTAYTLPQLEEIADHNGEPSRTFLQQLAQKHDVNLIAGSVANKKEDGIYNTAVVIDRKGNVVYEYDKAHLVPMLDEPKYMQGGKKRPEVFELEGLKIGLIICYDLRFPEIIRPLALDEAQALFIVAEWPEARANHWEHLQIARAIENQMYVLSANRIGSYNNVEFSGRSMVVNPWGDVLEKGSQHKEEVITTTLDLEKVKQVRKDVPIFESRVPDLYD
ncbi:carbon-nitrogen family hydrolase [Alkalibacillus haloalkaliphilus]|uniref:carbon-nitrogen family hydrolase n=1 Tax=Alkalibacillus haloalkaliphilus TaxID=94136 RepID=UPI000497FCF9|nr:carbon-nitrogen family hydrolase [Alkalibacillus haloalkaliphilus]